MEHSRTTLVTLVVASLVAAVFASLAHAASSAFDGNACALVTPAAARVAGVSAPCVQGTSGTTNLASWGTSATASDHFMALQVGPVKAVNPIRTSKVLPRGAGKLLGPILIAPGVKAYYSLSAYKGTGGGRGTMRFVDRSRLLQITLVNASGNTLSGLETVARAAVASM